MRNKHITIYKSERQYIIHSDSYTTAGVLLASEPYFKLDISVTPFELISHIKQALQASSENIPHPTNWDGQASQYAQVIGCSMKKLHKDFMHCSLQEDDKFITIDPSLNKGSKGGWIGIKNKKVTINKTASDTEIYQAIELAFAACEVW